MGRMDGRGEVAIHSPRPSILRRLGALGFTVLLACSDRASEPSSEVGIADGGLDASADGDAPNAKRLGDSCATTRECDDGVFCNGPEECFEGRCIGARSTVCRDFGGCAIARCDEATPSCVVDLPEAACASGSTCAPDVGCVKTTACTSDAACDDGRTCTDDRCDLTAGPANGRCIHLPIDSRCAAIGACGAPVCIGELSADPTGCAAKADASRCAATEGCDGTFTCVPLAASCASDLDCADGTACDGRERCKAGRCVHDAIATCTAHDGCHHALCRERVVGEPYCLETQLSGCL
jgi:hypothetical protein